MFVIFKQTINTSAAAAQCSASSTTQKQLKQKHFQFEYDTNKSLLFFTLCYFICCVFSLLLWWCLFCKEFPWKYRETKDAHIWRKKDLLIEFLVSSKFPDACVLGVVAKINNELIWRNVSLKIVWCFVAAAGGTVVAVWWIFDEHYSI